MEDWTLNPFDYNYRFYDLWIRNYKLSLPHHFVFLIFRVNFDFYFGSPTLLICFFTVFCLFIGFFLLPAFSFSLFILFFAFLFLTSFYEFFPTLPESFFNLPCDTYFFTFFSFFFSSGTYIKWPIINYFP